MSRRWVSIAGGIAFLGAFNSFFFSHLFTIINISVKHPELLNDTLLDIAPRIFLLAGFIVLARGLLSGKLNATIYTGLGLIILYYGVCFGIDIGEYVEKSIEELSRAEDYSDLAREALYTILYIAPFVLLLVMAIVTNATKKRKTKIFNVPAIIYIASCIVSLSREVAEKSSKWDRFTHTLSSLGSIISVTLAVLLLGMFIEGKGIAYEREKAKIENKN